MSALRIAGLLVLFGAGFLVTRTLLRSGEEPHAELPTTAAAASDAPQSQTRAARDQTASPRLAPRTIERGTEPLTEWQELVLAEPERAARTRGMIKGELYRYIAEGNHPASCLASDDSTVGDYRFVFETDVISSGDRVVTTPWRFVKVQDGTPISDEARACMEAMLDTRFTLEGPPGSNVFLASYDGTLQVDVVATAAEQP